MSDLRLEPLTNFQQWATSFAAEATKALEPLKTATATIADMWQPFREARDEILESFPSSKYL